MPLRVQLNARWVLLDTGNASPAKKGLCHLRTQKGAFKPPNSPFNSALARKIGEMFDSRMNAILGFFRKEKFKLFGSLANVIAPIASIMLRRSQRAQKSEDSTSGELLDGSSNRSSFSTKFQQTLMVR